MSTPDAELLISRLSGPLDPGDRASFRSAAESALAALPVPGEGVNFRVVVLLWKRFFHPPPDVRDALCYRGCRPNKLVDGQPPIARASRSDEL